MSKIHLVRLSTSRREEAEGNAFLDRLVLGRCRVGEDRVLLLVLSFCQNRITLVEYEGNYRKAS
jgi:hypothetical protein